MMQPPGYFEAIRHKASARWDQLEKDPELAAPWYQLFKQVQSPRHVLSELLQNADDANATQAVVDIRDGAFIFTHNGNDFAEEHFRSLCRFGYSNKRSLHTIGFRGVGFKSTFSIGDEVRLFTPTLSTAFGRDRFTEPIWMDGPNRHSGWTEIHVPIKDEHRKRELEKNLQEWFNSPVSLLFFRSIRRLKIGREEIHWIPDGPGPVAGSQWMKLSTASDRRYLIIQSPEEHFPEDALEEVRQERMALDEEISFPPCRVELVLGVEGRLFVVLPTGVKTDFPFASNAPFVQDPARVKIKDPEISPTNRWLFERIGKLAASAFLGWVGREDLSIDKRCDAYQLWIDADRNDTSLEGTCATIVKKAFGAALKNAPCLLSEAGKLDGWQKCVAVPRTLLDVWSADQVSAFFDRHKRPVLSRHISDDNRQKLVKWSCITEIGLDNVISVLESTHLPRPTTWRQLMLLWEYISNNLRYYWSRRIGVRIVPVQGADVLYAGSEVVRIGERQLLESQDDWTFLAKYLLVLNQNWPRYLAEQRRTAEGDTGPQVEAAYRVLRELGLDDTDDVGRVMVKVAERFYSQTFVPRKDCVRLAHLAAKLGAPVPETFQFVTRDDHLKPISSQVVVDTTSDLDFYVDKKWYDEHVLHEDYFKHFTSCTESEWRQWSTSPRSGLRTFVPLGPTRQRYWRQKAFLEELKKRGMEGEFSFPYRSDDYIIEDWDFEPDLWERWKDLAKDDEDFWARLMARIMQQPQTYWSKATAVRVLQVARTGSTRAGTSEELLPGWIIKFRQLPCLQDTWGRYCHPAELLRRTPETEALLDVEPFVRREFDTESLRPLLDLLGVRDTPTGPGSLLERLRALAGLDNPPVHEVQKWYQRLDQIIGYCSTQEFQEVKATFQSNKLILTESQGWARSTEVFLTADEEDVPGAAVIHPSVRHLSLWHKLQVPERPTADLAIQWLNSLPSRRTLSPDEARRVRSLLPRYPDRIWEECGHWVNLEGEWVPVTALSYALTMQSLVPWKHLFPMVKAKTADLQKLPADVCERYPFSSLPRLGACIEEWFEGKPTGLPNPEIKPWLTALGTGLGRIILEDTDETHRVRELGVRLTRTVWQIATGLETVPYIAGTPAGTPRRIDVLWKDCVLFVENRSPARTATAVAHELARAFNRLDIGDAIKLCYDRSPDFVTEYLEESFTLIAPEAIERPESVGSEADRGPMPDSVVVSVSPEDLVTIGSKEVAVAQEREEQDGAASAGSFNGLDGQQRKDGEQHKGGERDSNEGDVDAGGQTSSPAPRPPKLQQPSLIERFASANGFSKDGVDRFYHADGSWLAKITGDIFHWERRSAAGELLQYYWVKDHCIEREPLQLEAEIWLLCEQSPDLYSLLLTTPDGNASEISGRRLQGMRDGGELTLHPATYRLVYRT